MVIEKFLILQISQIEKLVYEDGNKAMKLN